MSKLIRSVIDNIWFIPESWNFGRRLFFTWHGFAMKDTVAKEVVVSVT